MTSDSTNLVPKLVQELDDPVYSDDSLDSFDPSPDTSPFVGGSSTQFNPETTTRREFAPLVVTRLGGTLPWDTQSTQLQCGETVTDANGDMNFRLVYHCVAPKSELETLQLMRANPNDVKLVSNLYSGPVTFDEMKVDRVPDTNGAVVQGVGERDEPYYTIQLQSKENSEN